MPPVLLLLILLLGLPTLEIYLLIQLGGLIGFLPTLLVVLGAAVLGAWLMRHQGLSALGRVRRALERDETPAWELLEGVVILLGGGLLLLPGLVTDVLGLLCLMPWTRRSLLAVLAPRLRVVTPQAPARTRADGEPRAVIEGEYRREKD